MAVRGLKTKIAINMALLLLISAALTGLVAILITQNLMIQAYLTQQERFLPESKDYWTRILQPAEGTTALPHNGLSNHAAIVRLGFSALEWRDTTEKTSLAVGTDVPGFNLLHSMTGNTLRDGVSQSRLIGLSWAVVWWHADTALVSIPVRQKGTIVAAVGAIIPLAPVLDRLRSVNRPIVLYILFNTAVLTIVGLYRIFHLYLRPIDRMVHQAEAYGDDDDFLFTFRREDNELNKLSKALNRMLGRISDDRQKLQESVASLAHANLELKKAQNDIVRAEKMASVGRLAAGVAHEIGNPIGIVLGYLDLLKQCDLESAEKQDFLLRSEKEIQRINTVIRQLLDLSRPIKSSPRTLSINDIVRDFADVLRAQPILANITFDTRLQATADSVHGDADQLRQVLLNILINAADAIREAHKNAEGKIRLSTVNSEDGVTAPAKWVTILIEDNGTGIPADQLPNIFDPFFTTKEPGKGTGLGLAVSYTLIEKMGGTITVRSNPGQGTRFALNLPLIPDKYNEKPGQRPTAGSTA